MASKTAIKRLLDTPIYSLNARTRKHVRAHTNTHTHTSTLTTVVTNKLAKIPVPIMQLSSVSYSTDCNAATNSIHLETMR